jgi:hypothetical protein
MSTYITDNDLFMDQKNKLYITDNEVMNAGFTISENKTFKIDNDTMVEIGDFKIKGEDLGRLLEKFAKEFMPQILV